MKITTQKLCRIALMAAIMVVLKEAMAFLPNGEFVSVITCVGALVFGWEMAVTTVVFSLIEVLIYGFGVWTVMYLYVWNILVVICLLLKPLFGKKKILWSILLGVYGFSFGALCAIPYIFAGGLPFAVSWWISGLSFDIMHMFWNVVFCYLTFDVFYKIFSKAKNIGFMEEYNE